MDEVEVSNVNANFASAAWTASCRGKTFYCHKGEKTVCTEEIPKANPK